MTKYTIEQAKELYAESLRLKLLRAESLLDPVRVSNVCNGIGAEWMPDFMRKAADKLSPVMQIPAAIHDIDYDEGGDASDRLAADLVFRANCALCINARYRWFNPWRYVMLARSDRYYEYLRTFGGLAWKCERSNAAEIHDRNYRQ